MKEKSQNFIHNIIFKIDKARGVNFTRRCQSGVDMSNKWKSPIFFHVIEIAEKEFNLFRLVSHYIKFLR